MFTKREIDESSTSKSEIKKKKNLSNDRIRQNLKSSRKNQRSDEPSEKKKSETLPETSTSSSSRNRTRVKVNLAAERLKNLRESLAKRINEKRGLQNLPSSTPPVRCRAKTEENQKLHPQKLEMFKMLKKTFNKMKPAKKNELNLFCNTHTEATVINDNKCVNSCDENTDPVSNDDDSGPLLVNDLTNISKHSEVNDSMEESMEWEPTDEESLLANIKEIRQELYFTTDTSNDAKTFDCVVSTSSKGTYIVVDSNIFISQLSLIDKLMNTDFPDVGVPITYLPWMVIQELDYMKNGVTSLARAAQKAIKFINLQLENKNPHFKAQTVMDASKCKLISKNPDDMILGCCLQLLEEQKPVVLLTNDMNLRNKALIHNIKTCDYTKVLAVLKPNKTSPNVKLKNSSVIQEMFNAYGNMWTHMQNVTFPYSLEEALTNLSLYWMPVYSFHLQKQCKQIIVNLQKLLNTKYDTSDDTMKKFTEYCVSLCVFFKLGYHKYIDKITKCISDIEKTSELV